MTIDLTPIDTLLATAAVDADRVRQLSDDWTADAIHETTTLDAERGVQVHRAEAVGDPPAEIATALGDVLHRCRAALDDTLVGLSAGPPSSESGFLIAATASGSTQNANAASPVSRTGLCRFSVPSSRRDTTPGGRRACIWPSSTG